MFPAVCGCVSDTYLSPLPIVIHKARKPPSAISPEKLRSEESLCSASLPNNGPLLTPPPPAPVSITSSPPTPSAPPPLPHPAASQPSHLPCLCLPQPPRLQVTKLRHIPITGSTQQGQPPLVCLSPFPFSPLFYEAGLQWTNCMIYSELYALATVWIIA